MKGKEEVLRKSNSRDLVAHADDVSYSGGGDWEDEGCGAAWA